MSASSLTKTEERVLELVAQGLPDKLIAAELHLTTSQIRYAMKRVLEKLQVWNRTGAALAFKGHPVFRRNSPSGVIA